jgi:predicted RNase H-like HicB family nuclease
MGTLQERKIMTKKEYNFRIEYQVDKKNGRVVATIPELNHISSFGDTFAEAEANMKEAVLCYLETLQMERKPIPKSTFHTEGTYIKLFGTRRVCTRS